MKIGYSFWGFLGAGVTDTPDGGRSHRRVLVDGLRSLGHDLVFLQADRDLTEAATALPDYTWDSGLPGIDVLFLEWRWAVPGRNDTPCGHPGHTCDLHRQADLIDHYTRDGVPTLVWDKDQQLAPDDPINTHPAVTVCEPALFPKPGRVSLLFPVADDVIDEADPVALSRLERDIPLVYVGNQYDRDDAFRSFLAPAAGSVRHIVAGKWPTGTTQWPQVRFTGRVPFTEVEELHRRALTTVLLTPARYARTGQFTQRIFEAVLAGCLPLGPSTIRGVDRVVPEPLLVASGDEVADRVTAVAALAGTEDHAALITQCLRHLQPFRLSEQLRTLAAILPSL
jgi:hypothetical protein